ncbi:Gfo/Idh/MocA family oxidoreductase [Pseudomonas xanthosomatis]|uniref:Gfo/Idh/MocA family protein n=1 Tax=Pseudomonas xanthosomatis TaxID=2842356 RepID=UPI001C3C4EE3|nr:Gfo/Idh/MocA family oxidoreductase [Pseudomonas xanthosomatis]QXH48310.1 Gfo/Idh/MocA family oxidoreductase [Pseudomonas xanthosomatis]
MTKKVKVAIVGAGYMASEHLKAFEATGEAQVVGITSRTRERAQALVADHEGIEVFDSLEVMYEKTRADIVVVTVTELHMADVAKRCFEFPWLVLLEKPAGYNLADARDIQQAAHAKKARVHVALNRRAYSSTRQALDVLKGNEGPRFIKVLDQQDQHAALTIHNNPPLMVENYMFANSIHLIDYLRVLGRGEVVSVENIVKWDPAAPGIVLASITFSSGDTGLYEGVWNGPGPWVITVNTPDNRLEMRPLEQVSVQLKGERRSQALDIEEADSLYKPGLLFQAQQAILASQGQANVLPDIDDSFKSMELVASIFNMDG